MVTFKVSRQSGKKIATRPDPKIHQQEAANQPRQQENRRGQG